MSSLCIKNASVIVTCDDQDSVLENSSILIEDGVIRLSLIHISEPTRPY